MGTIGNPGISITESGIARERVNNYPLYKGTGRTPDKKDEGENKTSKFTQNILLSKDIPEKLASKPEIKIKESETTLGFAYDGEIKKAILRVVDEETKEVIFQVPPEEVINRMKEDLKKENKEIPAGIIVDKEA